MNRKNATRNALFTSILSLLLCVSMLVGTSFAWFTDSVTSGRNTITAGRLDIELYNGTEINAETKVGADTKLFDGVNLWEPGVVVWENLTVANVGNLALKYTLELNVLEQTTTTVEGTTYQLSDAIKVGVVRDGITAGSTRDDVIGAVTEWTSLTGFDLGKDDVKLTANATETFGIVLYWQPGDNDNIFNLNNDRLNGNALKLEIGVALTANQVEEESDSFGDNYDADAGKAETETPAQKLQALLDQGESVTLEEDIELADNESLSITTDVTLNLNGHTIMADGDALVVTSGTLTLEGEGTVAAGTSGVGSANAVWANGGHVIINGGTYSVGGDTEVAGTDPTHQNDVIYTKNGGTAVINGGTFLNDVTVWTLNQKDAGSEAGGEITVKGGTFQNWNPADNVSEGAKTNFVAEGYEATAETKDGDTWYTVVEKTAEPEPVTVYGTIKADTFVTSNNKETPYNDSKELSVRTGGTTSKIYYRSYFQVDFSEVIATQGFNKDNAKVTFTFTRIAGSADNNTGFTMKAFADVTDIDFANLNWTEVKDGTYADELGWTSDAATTLEPVISVEGDTITITVDYSDIENKAIFAFTSDSSDLEIASMENTTYDKPTVSVTYTPAAE